MTNATLTQPAANSTMTISGSLTMNGATVSYNAGDLIALPNGALTLSGSDYIAPLLHLSARARTPCSPTMAARPPWATCR